MSKPIGKGLPAQESMASWLSKAADEFKDIGLNSKNHSSKTFLAVHLLINEYIDGHKQLKKLKVWSGMPVVERNTGCFRHVSELLEYLDRYCCRDLNATAAYVLLEALANIHDRIWLFGDTDRRGYRPSWM